MERIPGAPTDDVGADVADLIHSVARRFRAASHHDLEPLGVTPAQVRALRTIGRRGEPVRMSELADRLRIARRSATSVVDELVERGLAVREVDPDDRRAVLVAVAPDGAALLRRFEQRRRAEAARVTGRLGAADLVTLRRLLRRLDED